jgi:hypothetical protein
MFRHLLICLLALSLFGAVVQAHGDATHLLGTVSAISGNHITIKDKAGKSVMVMLTKTTKYLRDKKTAPGSELKVGVRVVIDAKMDNAMKMFTAEEIQLGVID